MYNARGVNETMTMTSNDRAQLTSMYRQHRQSTLPSCRHILLQKKTHTRSNL